MMRGALWVACVATWLAGCASGESAGTEDEVSGLHLAEVLASLELGVERVEGVPIDGVDAAWQIRTPGLRTWFVEDRVLLRDRADVQRWSVELAFAGWGRGAPTQRPPLLHSSAEGPRLVLDRGEVQEWYVDREDGLEQGFTLSAPPPGSGPVVLDIEVVEGDASLVEDAVVLSADDQGRVLYDKLLVLDAEGRELPSELELVGCADAPTCAIRIRFDAEGAAWPVEVDPLVTSLEAERIALGGSGRAGFALDVRGGRAIVGVPGDPTAGPGAGRAILLTRNSSGGSLWTVEAALDAPSTIEGFGEAVALSYPYAAVAAPGSNRVYVYEHTGAGAWTLVKELHESAGAAFGSSVALSGEALLVGDPYTGVNRGSVHVFHRLAPPGWGELDPPEFTHTPANQALFGSSVAFRDNVMVVGAPGQDRVWVFGRDGFNTFGRARFSQQALLQGSTGSGHGAAVDFDGVRVVVGAPESQEVRLYGRNAQGSWAVFAQAPLPPSENESFGRSVAIDGTSVAVSGLSAHGAPYVHLYDEWSNGSAHFVESRRAGAEAGTLPIALALDGSTLGVGLPEEGLGAVGLYHRAATRWTPTTQLAGVGLPGNQDGGPGSVLAWQGDFLAVGMPDSDAMGVDAGGVVILQRSDDAPDSWEVLQTLSPATWSAGTRFGSALDFDGDLLLVGAENDKVQSAAYLYGLGSGGWTLQHTFTPPSGVILYGGAVALDQEFAVVGARESGGGRAYVYYRHAGGVADSWAEVQVLEHNQVGAEFGYAVALDVPLLAVGAPAANTYATGAGEVRVYRFDSHQNWFQQEASLGVGVPAGSRLGRALVLQNELLVAGAPTTPGGGEARVYVRTMGAGLWSEEGPALPTTSSGGEAGQALLLLGDELWVGAPGQSRVHVHARNEGGIGKWGEARQLAGASGERYGSAIVGDGTFVVIGAPEHDGGRGGLFEVRRDAQIPPVAHADVFYVDEDHTLHGNVLLNDFDANGDPLTAHLTLGTSNGALSLQEDGKFTYTPHPDWYGTDTFRYRAHDGYSTSPPALVTIHVLPVNDPPVGYPNHYETDEDVPLVVPASEGVLHNDVDVDGDELFAHLLQDVQHGVLTLHLDGGFEYVPNDGFHGEDGFVYRAFDGELYSDPVEVTLLVRYVARDPEAYDSVWETDVDVPLIVPPPGLFAHGDRGDAEGARPELLEGPEHGHVIVRPNGSFDYLPPDNWHGEISFTWRLTDGADSSPPAVAAIVVHWVNRPPVAEDDAYQVLEDRLLVIPAARGVLANDHDVDVQHPHHLLQAHLHAAPVNGAVTLALDGGFEYMPNPDYFGADTFQYVVRDPDGGESDPATVTIQVLPVNDRPVAVDDQYLLDPPDGLAVDEVEGVLANDYDVDGDPLVAVLVQQPRRGTVELGEDGAFVYAPDPGYHGADYFTYVADDGELTSYPARVDIQLAGEPPAPEEEDCLQVYYLDRDGDGYGDDDTAVETCDPGPMLVEVGGDCDDHVASVHPGALEIPGDGIDQNCDGFDGGFQPVGACRVGPASGSMGSLLVGLLIGLRRRGRAA